MNNTFASTSKRGLSHDGHDSCMLGMLGQCIRRLFFLVSPFMRSENRAAERSNPADARNSTSLSCKCLKDLHTAAASSLQ